jgi:hypothetical protein
VPVLDRKGRVRHDGGVVTEAPGLYLMGLQFMRRRKSALIDGAGDDARELSAHIARFLGGPSLEDRPQVLELVEKVPDVIARAVHPVRM